MINQHLADKGLRLREGTTVDATIIAAPISTKNADDERDPENASGKEGQRMTSRNENAHRCG